MKIINNIETDNPNQWIERFVEQVLENAGIDCEQALIEEIEEEKRILLSAGGQRYDIRIQAFLPVAADLNGMVCTENVQYVLYRKNTENGREYGEAIDDDFIRIQRGNTAAYEEVQENTGFPIGDRYRVMPEITEEEMACLHAVDPNRARDTEF